MLFSVDNKSMQQGKLRPRQDLKPSLLSNIGERVSTLASNRSQDTKSRIFNPSRINNPSYLKQFKKNTKIKLNTLSSIANVNIEDQVKKELTLVEDILKECDFKVKERKLVRTEKEDLIFLQEIIRCKDDTIKSLGAEIEGLKKLQRTIYEQESPTDSSDKERLFKLAEEMKQQRQDLTKYMIDHVEKYNSYAKIKKLIEQIEIKYTSKGEEKSLKDQNYHGPQLITYQEFKQKARIKKDEVIPPPKAKKNDFYHHLSKENQANPSMNMKDLITRKNITMAALKNSRKKHNVEMAELIAKLDFLKDEDAHLTQKIKEKEQQLASMERKFSERRGQKNKFQRSPLLHFHS